MKSVIEFLNTEQFYRIRIGIGMPERKEELTSYVIGKISEEDLKKFKTSISNAAKAVIEIIKNGIEKAMNKFN